MCIKETSTIQSCDVKKGLIRNTDEFVTALASGSFEACRAADPLPFI